MICLLQSEQIQPLDVTVEKKNYAGSSFPFKLSVLPLSLVSFIALTLITPYFHGSIVMQIPTGTTEVKRTTVPFMYNLEEDVEGLNVVDFPGVDDEDDTIGDLADLLVTIAQIIIFVVDYRCVCLVSK